MVKVSISSISQIRFGHHCPLDLPGKVAYLQVKNFSEGGRLTPENIEYVPLNNSTEAQLLRDGDVLFVGKGNRLFAWCYHQPINQSYAIASSIFFVLKPDSNKILPDYLSAILNAPQVRAAFQQLGSGTNILSIRKSELGAFEIPLPPLEDQQKIAALTELHQKEIDITKNLLSEKQQLYASIISKLIK